ncbi:MAG: alpha/beta hydrolase [Silvanigrellales bacterium]|jgi:acylglycerol lipase|nr:alpha/beta hydrolase [Silvanigrellales bacterium]
MTLERTEFLKTFDGNDLFFRCFVPRAEGHSHGGVARVEGLVLAVHGFAEHSGRYAEVAEAVCKKGLAFACFDLRGHGKSGPRRGDAENIHAMILDVLFVTNHAKSFLGLSQRQDIFFGLLGHSFGALLVTYAASILHDTCPPLFLSSPLYKIRQDVPAWKKLAANALPRFAPLLPVPIGIDPQNISVSQENIASYMADELNLFSISARFGNLFLGAVNDRDVNAAVARIKAPVTICVGEKDTLVDTNRVKQAFPLFGSRRTRLHTIAGAGHEILNETPELRAEAYRELMAWIDNKGLPASAP